MTCTRWRSPCPGTHKNYNGPPSLPGWYKKWISTGRPDLQLSISQIISQIALQLLTTMLQSHGGSADQSWFLPKNLGTGAPKCKKTSPSHRLIHPANWSFFKCNFKRSGLLARQHFVHWTKPGTGRSHANPTWCELLSHTWKRINSFSHTFWACTGLFGEGKKV